jgi:hypothetical protein
MAKRYHQSMKDRMHESMGERRSMHERDRFNDEKRHDRGDENARGNRFREGMQETFNGMEGRRRREMEDAGMIYEDPNAIANLPQNVMMTPYPKTGPYMPEGLNDDIRGVDHQMDYDDSKRREHWYPKKV